MNRREAIRQSALWAGVAALWASLPARTWAALERPPGWSDAEESLLTLIGDTIIPTTATSPGAGAVGIGRFILVQATDCYAATAAAPETVRRGLKEIEEASRKAHAKGLADLSVAQREKVLTDYEGRPASVIAGAGGGHPFRLIKELTLLGYFTSEPGATQALRYLPVPGGYKGSLKLGKDERSWAL
ncbi:MAG: gluconate 2-dehydrogenase subunit 3 family protein [Verrucomicrobia bacterium]|nr:gluconate 2-dehydrogenase subunit 3 family protein [Verrucomicrobiota bacterium]